jgi:hypothetical protein
MNLEQIKNKRYEIPLNIPQSTSHKYSEVIEKQYAKYLDAINQCGKFIMFRQFFKLTEAFSPTENTEVDKERNGLRIIKRIADLGFIDTASINKNKYIYLKKAAFALSEGDYKNSTRISLASDLKNDRFQIAILKSEYLLQYGEIIHSSTMFTQLKTITTHIFNTIRKTGNSFGYALENIEELLELDDYIKIKEYLDQYPEFQFKFGIIRGLWSEIGSLYKKMLLQKQTVTDKPILFKLFVKKDGEIILHYIANIVIFDVSHDGRFYKDKAEKLFHAFYSVEGNNLRDIQKTYLKDKNMGYQGEHHLGYKLTLIGADEEVLMKKKEVVDEGIDSSVNSPLMDYTEIVPLPIGQYLLHASRKNNEYADKQDDMINNLILKQLNRINKPSKKTSVEVDKKDIISKVASSSNLEVTKQVTKVSAGQKVLDFVQGD